MQVSELDSIRLTSRYSFPGCPSGEITVVKPGELLSTVCALLRGTRTICDTVPPRLQLRRRRWDGFLGEDRRAQSCVCLPAVRKTPEAAECR